MDTHVEHCRMENGLMSRVSFPTNAEKKMVDPDKKVTIPDTFESLKCHVFEIQTCFFLLSGILTSIVMENVQKRFKIRTPGKISRFAKMSRFFYLDS